MESVVNMEKDQGRECGWIRGSKTRRVRRGAPAAAKGPDTGQQLRDREAEIDFVCMPSCLWLGHPSQLGGVDIGCILHWPAVPWDWSVVAGDREGGAPLPSSHAPVIMGTAAGSCRRRVWCSDGGM